MDIFNVGLQEFLFIGILAFILLGPEGFQKTSKDLGKCIYRFMHSPTWIELQKELSKVRDFPRSIIREAGLEETMQEIQREKAAISRELNSEPFSIAGPDWNQKRQVSSPPEPAVNADVTHDQDNFGNPEENQNAKSE